MHAWVDGRMNGWMDGWIDGGMDGRTDGCMYLCMLSRHGQDGDVPSWMVGLSAQNPQRKNPPTDKTDMA